MDKETEDYLSLKLRLIRSDIELLRRHSLYVQLSDESEDFLCALTGEIKQVYMDKAASMPDIDLIPQDVLEQYVVSQYWLEQKKL
jgi:hypothetical protein